MLSNSKVVMYTFYQTEGKKGADSVVSILDDFIENHVDESVEELRMFCDSCFVFKKRFKTITVTFPIQSHIYGARQRYGLNTQEHRG